MTTGGTDTDLFPDALFHLDADRRLLAVNRAVTELTGFRGDDLIGRPAGEALNCHTADGRALLVDGWPRAARLRSVRAIPEHEVVMRAADGSDVVTLVTGTYQRDVDGRVVGAVVAARDASRRRAGP
ncbi:MAG: PAS domain-containing protein, partial [Actinomycetota bacterium]|nr:PAS domain-containing protein [Actinomycetota bacterium]